MCSLSLEALLNAASHAVEFDLHVSRESIVAPLRQVSRQRGSTIRIELREPAGQILARADPTRVREQYQLSHLLVEERSKYVAFDWISRISIVIEQVRYDVATEHCLRPRITADVD